MRVAQFVKRDHPAVAVVMSEQDISALKLMTDAAGTPHSITKSRLGIDLIPLLTVWAKPPETHKVLICKRCRDCSWLIPDKPYVAS